MFRPDDQLVTALGVVPGLVQSDLLVLLKEVIPAVTSLLIVSFNF